MAEVGASKTLPEASPLYYTSYVTSIEATLHLVLAGSHIGVMPKHYVQELVGKGELKSLLEDELSFAYDIAVITHAHRKSDALTSSFLSVVHEIMG